MSCDFHLASLDLRDGTPWAALPTSFAQIHSLCTCPGHMRGHTLTAASQVRLFQAASCSVTWAALAVARLVAVCKPTPW